MSPPAQRHPLTVEGRRVEVTNPDRVMYPKAGFTKAQVIDYYVRIAPALLPHLQGRPLSLKRYPGGVEAGYFYQKEAPANRPEWLATAPVYSETRDGPINYCMANDLPSLVWLANAADLELHTFLHKAKDVTRPTMMMLDLDPGAPADVVDCARVALWLRDDLKDLGLRSWAKVSGGKGMQLHVPLNVPTSYEETKPFSRALAEVLAARHPDLVTSVMRKDQRGGKVFIDWSQNDTHKTTVCVYSLRGQPTPTVAAPVTWDELEQASESADAASLRFTPEEAVARFGRHGDLMADVLRLKQRMPAEAP